MKLTDQTLSVYSPSTGRLYLCNLLTGRQICLSGRDAKAVDRRLRGRSTLRRIDISELHAAGMVR